MLRGVCVRESRILCREGLLVVCVGVCNAGSTASEVLLDGFCRIQRNKEGWNAFHSAAMYAPGHVPYLPTPLLRDIGYCLVLAERMVPLNSPVVLRDY